MPVDQKLIDTASNLEQSGKTPSEILDLIKSSQTYSDIGGKIGDLRSQGMQDDKIYNFLKTAKVSNDVPRGTSSPNFVSRINEDLVKRGVNIADVMRPSDSETLKETISRLPERTLRTTGQAAGFVTDVAGEAIKSAYTTIASDRFQDVGKKALFDTMNDPKNRPFIEGVTRAVDKFKKENPETYKNLEAMGNIISLALGSKPVQGASIKAGNIAEKGIDIAKQAIKKTPESIDKKLKSSIREGISKSIRPGVEGKRTFGQTEKFFNNAQEAVQNIVSNKESLKLTNEFGEVVEGLPKNLQQFSQAIDQTKRQIFSSYDKLAKDAGTKGAQVELTPIAKELNDVVNSKVLKKFAPETVKYAESRARAIIGESADIPSYLQGKMREKVAGALGSSSKLTTTEAQEAIAALNNSREAFYKNPSYDSASKAYIDALIVNNLRKGLDKTIETTVGPGYQKLKTSYGSLKAIERDVNRRAIVDARKNIKGLVDFSDIFSGSAAIHGIISMNPGMIGGAATAKWISHLYKLRVDPNRIVKNMFEKTEKLIQKRGKLTGGRELSSVIKDVEKRTVKQTTQKIAEEELKKELGTSLPLQIGILERYKSSETGTGDF